MHPDWRVLSVVPRATGYMHVTTDARIDCRPVLAAPLEMAHEALDLDLPTILERLAFEPPRRMTRLT